jgi:hypothetical protein
MNLRTCFKPVRQIVRSTLKNVQKHEYQCAFNVPEPIKQYIVLAGFAQTSTWSDRIILQEGAFPRQYQASNMHHENNQHVKHPKLKQPMIPDKSSLSNTSPNVPHSKQTAHRFASNWTHELSCSVRLLSSYSISSVSKSYLFMANGFGGKWCAANTTNDPLCNHSYFLASFPPPKASSGEGSVGCQLEPNTLRCLSVRPSVRPSVCPSVCQSDPFVRSGRPIRPSVRTVHAILPSDPSVRSVRPIRPSESGPGSWAHRAQYEH